MNHSKEFIQLYNQIKKNIVEITDDEAFDLLNRGECDFLIDVRDKDEYDSGSLPNALHLSKGWIEAKIHQLVDDKNARLIVYCGGGHRSALAADNLRKMGYTQVKSMRGGFKAWTQSGKPVC